jgi:hypothetical protein
LSFRKALPSPFEMLFSKTPAWLTT